MQHYGFISTLQGPKQLSGSSTFLNTKMVLVPYCYEQGIQLGDSEVLIT